MLLVPYAGALDILILIWHDLDDGAVEVDGYAVHDPRPCADEVYFTAAREITWPDMNWTPQSDPATSADADQGEIRGSSAGDSCSSDNEMNR